MGGYAAAQGTYDTVTLTFWEALPGFVSPVVALTLVELLSVLPLAAVTLTTMVTVGAVAAPTWPRVHVTLEDATEQLPWLAVADL